MAFDVTVQLGMFGVSNRIAGAHVVAAHTRVKANGDEIFVGEHMRWNRGRTARASAPRPPGDSTHDDASQQDLFIPRPQGEDDSPGLCR